MYYLYEHQLGFHSLALGFPSIGTCNAICLQTTAGLFGVHVYGCDSFNKQAGSNTNAMERESTAFAAFVNNHPNRSGFVHLYSANFHSKRQHQPAGTVDGWKKELKYYAKALGYTGPVSSFDLSSLTNWPTNGSGLDLDSAYVEFRRVFDQVTILCKPWGQCVHPPEQKPGPPVADGVNYRSTTQAGQVSDTFWFKKMISSVTTNGSGFILTPLQTRLTFKFKG